MIEINLIPDVKQEFIKAKRARNVVISSAVIVGVVSIGIVLLLTAYLGVQAVRSTFADKAITTNSNKLKDVPDLANMLTIQSQLAGIKQLHDNENISSRMFDLLTAASPTAPNQVTYSNVALDTSAGTIHIDGQAVNGFVAADVFKKTIAGVTVTYQQDSQTQTDNVAKNISISNLSYGEDASGAKVLRFSIDFEYDPILFAATSQNVTIQRPKEQNATDSFKYLPQSLFSDRASDIGGSQ